MMNSLGKDKAIELANTHWWESATHREIAEFQLFTTELCCPFTIFHEAVEKSLGRPVFTHEFGSNGYNNLVLEFLGVRKAPSLDDIINLLPEKNRIVLVT